MPARDAMLQAGAGLCLAVVAVLSLLPGPEMVRTGMGGSLEHVIAYAGTALACGLAWASRGWRRLTLALLLFAGAMEVLQSLSPGRFAGFDDFLFSSTGVLIGVAAAALAQAARFRWS